MKDLIVLTEEGYSDSLLGAIKLVSDKFNLNADTSDQILPQSFFSEEKQAIGFTIPQSPNSGVANVVCLIVSPPEQGSFVDSLFYLNEEGSLPSPSDEPLSAVEITKNGLGESGNMSDQRAAKFMPLKLRFPDLFCAYYIHTIKPINEVPAGHARAFDRMATCGIDIWFGTNDSLTQHHATKYIDVMDLVVRGMSDKARTNRMSLVENNEVILQTNLLKSGSYCHDPNIGWVSSVLFSLYKLGFNGKVSLTEHNLTEKLTKRCFSGKNKLAKAFRFCANQFDIDVSLFGNISPSDCYEGDYWSYANTGEKIGSILLEVELRNLGHKVLFTNHAGCEKSYLETEQGEFVALPKGREFGLPDLITELGGTLYAIEAETSKNYKKGVDQIEEEKFGKTLAFIQKEYYNAPIEVFLSTFGSDCMTKKHVLASTATNGKTTIDFNKPCAYTI